MSTQTEPFRFTLPPGFARVPDRSGPELGTWLSEMMTPPTSWVAGSSISTDLERLSAAMDTEPADGRTWFVLIPSPPYHRGITAFGWINGSPATETILEDVRSSVGSVAQRQNPRTLSAAIDHRSTRGRETLTAHLLQAAAGAATSGARLVERCTALMVDQELALVVRLEITAFDLRTFDDIVSSVHELLESVVRTGARP